jgi:hypothetical protein
MKIPLLIASFCVATSVAQAAAVEPKLTRFGSIGGSLPTSGNSWAISEFRESGGRGLTLGLTASTRNGDPGQTVNNSAGAFFTSSGLGLNLPAGVDNLARWDLGVYFASSNPRLGNTAIALLYDFDPAPPSSTMVSCLLRAQSTLTGKQTLGIYLISSSLSPHLQLVLPASILLHWAHTPLPWLPINIEQSMEFTVLPKKAGWRYPLRPHSTRLALFLSLELLLCFW